MTQNQNSVPTPTTIGLFEAVRGEWKLTEWVSTSPLSDLLYEEAKELVAAWVAAGGQEFGVETPILTPVSHKDLRAKEVFPRWALSIEGRRLVARPEWGYFGDDPKIPQPEVPERTVGLLHEETEEFAGSELLTELGRGLVAVGQDLCGGAIVPLRGFAAEAAAWRNRLRSVLADIATAEREARKAAERAHVEDRKQAGWKEFTFRSTYYGSHDGGDTEQVFLFRPGVDLSRWEGVEFSHGEHSQSEPNDEFDSWLDGLAEGDDYIEVD
jgi:hypothetical protein